MTDREAMKMAFELLCDAVEPTATQIQADIGMCAQWDVDAIECIEALRQALAQPDVTMADAVAAGDSVLLNEQAALLRECRAALDSLIKQKPTLAGLLCGSTTLGNLKAELHAYRPQGILGDKHD